MGHEEGRRSETGVDLSQPLGKAAPDLGVQGPEGFVQEENLRAWRQGSGQSDSLSLPTRELVGVVLPVVRELHQFQERFHPLADLPGGDLPDLQAEGDVPLHGQVFEEGVILEDKAQGAFLHRFSGDLFPSQPEPPPVGPLQPRDHPQERALSRTARAEQSRQLSLLHGEGDTVDNRGLTEPLGEILQPQAHLSSRERLFKRLCMMKRTKKETAARTREAAKAPAYWKSVKRSWM